MNNLGDIPPATEAPPPSARNTSAPHPALHPASEFARHADVILNSILLLIAASFRILGARTVPLWNRVSRTRQRLIRLLAHLAAGRLPRPHIPRAPTALPHAARERDPLTALPPPRLPRANLLLIKLLGYHAAGYASQLQHLLDQPGMAAALAAAPGAARTLRPLCRILGVNLPAILRLPPRPPRQRPAKPARPKPLPLPPLLPLYPQRKPRPMPFLPPFVKFRPT